MNGKIPALASLVAALAAFDASAATITLNFEGVGNNAQILDFYNGGTDSQGHSGTNYGVHFGSNSLGIVDRDAGGDGNFANEPTPDTIMYFLTGSAILNYAPGFDVGFSFFYTTSVRSSVTVWSGLNASGSILGTISLAPNSIANGCKGDPQGGPGDPNGQFCHFDIGSLGFLGIAKSVNFSGTVNQVGFDNITFGSTDPGTPVPLPAGGWFLAAAGLGLSSFFRTKREPHVPARALPSFA